MSLWGKKESASVALRERGNWTKSGEKSMEESAEVDSLMSVRLIG